MARKAISGSVRWQIFARDNFRCRYCGAQAGEPGVILHVDHVVSVVDGGTNAYDNLLTACQRCNNGKWARSLDHVPGSEEAIKAAERETASLKQQADAIAESIEARDELEQEVINLVCHVYGAKTFQMCDRNIKQLTLLVQRHGHSLVEEWLLASFTRHVPTSRCVKYIHGIIRILRERGEVA